MSVIGAERHALKAVGDGVDAVIASGRDGGGHVGEVGTAALVPSVVNAVGRARYCGWRIGGRPPVWPPL